MSDDLDDFGGFEEAQPSVNVNSTNSSDFLKSDLPIKIEKQQRPPEWLLETFKIASNSQKCSTTTPLAVTNNSSLEDQLKRAFTLIQNQQENYQNLQKQIELLRSTNIQMNKELESNLKIENLKQIKQLCEENEKIIEQKLSVVQNKFDKSIQKMNIEIDEKFERKLASTQEQLIKHYESENEILEMRLNKLFMNQIDEEISMKLKKSIDIILKEQKCELEKLLKQQFNSLNDCFKDQIKCNIEQETLILKDIVNKKLEFLIKNYENKSKRTNYLYSRQLTNLSSFLDNAKIQIDLMQNHIKKQADATLPSTAARKDSTISEFSNNNDTYEDELEDETLLNM